MRFPTLLAVAACVPAAAPSPTTHARPIELVSNHGEATGKVAGSGWRWIETPDGQSGSLDLWLRWQPPRPGVDVAFDVLDQWHQPIVTGATVHARDAQQRVQPGVTIDDASGRYFVRVYSPDGAADAGTYQLTARFRPAAVAQAAPAPPAPEVAPQPPVAPPVRRPPTPTPTPTPTPIPTPIPSPIPSPIPTPSPSPSPSAHPADPIVARAIDVAIVGGLVRATVPIRNDVQVTAAWRAFVLAGDSDRPLPGGTATIVRIAHKFVVISTRLTLDELSANPRVKLVPP
jgi:hypothetical protein